MHGNAPYNGTCEVGNEKNKNSCTVDDDLEYLQFNFKEGGNNE
jgi:hypothetical protein